MTGKVAGDSDSGENPTGCNRKCWPLQWRLQKERDEQIWEKTTLLSRGRSPATGLLVETSPAVTEKATTRNTSLNKVRNPKNNSRSEEKTRRATEEDNRPLVSIADGGSRRPKVQRTPGGPLMTHVSPETPTSASVLEGRSSVNMLMSTLHTFPMIFINSSTIDMMNSMLSFAGHNGTIDGQGKTWWEKHEKKQLNHTRGPLVQIMWSSDIVIANITLRYSPFWTLHPYDCKNVTIRNVTILAPLHHAPNTDGIDPDSCEDMVIEDCYISVGDDGIAIKSGWDQYGIAYGRPSTNILIRNLVVRSEVSAGISIGSEMSGGVSNVTVENTLIWNSRRAVRIKTAPGRGGYIQHITYRNLTFDFVRVGIVIKTDYNEHPDEGYDPKALPTINDISFISIHGHGVRVPVRIHGSMEIPVTNVTFRDFSVGLSYKKKRVFQCAFVQGRVIGAVFPAPCKNLDLYDEKGRLVRRSVAQNIADTDYDA
ncbi:hypothetical protein Cgig2_010243 [Carnegiea gigantea]|uniref:Polygalacturonase n=1 Tax=Carnegiea gigantea TaxID=171969 RepID=A0A9Q1GZ55_9CARY|nr:hypothetical protein Cgig2_010243 [Carnegiea gigantea]